MIKGLKKKLTLILAVTMGLTMSAVSYKPVKVDAAAVANVNVSAEKQRISGFGASSAWCGALGDGVMDTLYKDIGLSILRVRMEPNEGWNRGDFRAWNDELSNAKKAKARGAIVFATPWTAPASMKTNNSTKGSGGATLKSGSVSNYAKYLESYIDYFAKNGAPLYGISVQNEPDWTVDYDGCRWTGEQIRDFIKTYGASLSKKAKIIMPESLGFNHALSDPTLNDPQACQYASIVGGHLYGAKIQDYTLARQKGKEIWMTEFYQSDQSLNGSMKFAKEIHDCLTVGNMSAYVYWWLNNTDVNSLIDRQNKPYQRAYILGQFAKFIRYGYNRVDATSNPQSNVYVSAYTGDNKVVMVAINQGTSAVNQTFNVQNGTPGTVSRWTTSGSQNMVKDSDIKAANGSFIASLPAQSVTTFVASLDGTPVPNPTPDPTPDPKPVVVPGETAKLADGWYYIKNVNAQKYLQVKDKNVELGAGTGADVQRWYLKNLDNGYVTLKNASSDVMVDIAYGKDEDGANAGVYNAYSGDAQQFVLKTTSAKDTYVIATKCSNLTKVLDDEKKSTADGANVCQWSYTGGTNQQWGFEPVNNTSVTPVPDPTPNPTPAKLKLDYTINNWGSSYQVNFKVTNNSSADVNGWTLKIKKSDINIGSSWNISVTESGDYYVIKPVDWNTNIAKGASVEFGVQGSGSIGSTINYTLS